MSATPGVDPFRARSAEVVFSHGVTEFASYVDGWKRKWAEDEAAARARSAVAWDVCEKIRDLLRDAFGARRVMVTGSLARGDFRRDSDIDLAVEGLSDAQFFAASAEAQRIAGDLPVDVVPIEAGSDAYLQDLRAIGVVLHGPALQDSGESTDKA